MSWLEPLSLQTIMISLFAGNNAYFLGIALIAIMALAAYFRMASLVMFVMIGMFLLMFNDYIPNSIAILMVIIAALIIGLRVSKIVKN